MFIFTTSYFSMMIKKTTANNNMIVEKLICTSQHDISTEWDHHHCSSSVIKNEHAEVNILIKMKKGRPKYPKKKKKPLLCLLSIIEEGMMMAWILRTTMKLLFRARMLTRRHHCHL